MIRCWRFIYKINKFRGQVLLTHFTFIIYFSFINNIKIKEQEKFRNLMLC